MAMWWDNLRAIRDRLNQNSVKAKSNSGSTWDVAELSWASRYSTRKLVGSLNVKLSIAKYLNLTFVTWLLLLTWDTCKLLEIYSVIARVNQSSDKTQLKLDSSELGSTQTWLKMFTSRVVLPQTRTRLASLLPLLLVSYSSVLPFHYYTNSYTLPFQVCNVNVRTLSKFALSN